MFYIAAAIFTAGLALRLWQYARTPVPLKIPTTPAPVTRAGAAFRVLREVTVFESLFKSNKWIWLFGWVFHASLALVLFRHLRYFTQPVWSLVALMQPFGVYAGFAMVGALFALWVRRVAMARMRYISDAFDHLVLLLLDRHWSVGARDEVRGAHRHRFGERFHPRAYGVRLAAAPCRSAAASLISRSSQC